VVQFRLIGELLLIQAWDSIMTPGQDFIEPGTVLKCDALQIKLLFSTLHSSVPYARIKLLFETFKIKYFFPFETNHWYTAEKEKTNDTKSYQGSNVLHFL
jgi:hypothetical protein